MTSERPPSMADLAMMRDAVQASAVAGGFVAQRLRLDVLMPCVRVAALTEFVGMRVLREAAASLLPREEAS